jgi:hypothetical protein
VGSVTAAASAARTPDAKAARCDGSAMPADCSKTASSASHSRCTGSGEYADCGFEGRTVCRSEWSENREEFVEFMAERLTLEG